MPEFGERGLNGGGAQDGVTGQEMRRAPNRTGAGTACLDRDGPVEISPELHEREIPNRTPAAMCTADISPCETAGIGRRTTSVLHMRGMCHAAPGESGGVAYGVSGEYMAGVFQDRGEVRGRVYDSIYVA